MINFGISKIVRFIRKVSKNENLFDLNSSISASSGKSFMIRSPD